MLLLPPHDPKESEERIKSVLHNLFYNVLDIEANLAIWVKNIRKYGTPEPKDPDV